MPVTPFHIGPALVVKAALRHRFSLGVFSLVQCVIDIESVTNIVRNNWPVHAHLHTVVGSLVVATVCAVVGRPLVSKLKPILLNRIQRESNVLAWAKSEVGPVTFTGAVLGALFGALSHVLLDAMMHADMRPLLPFLSNNPFLVNDSFTLIHIGCLLVGIVGYLLWMKSAGDKPSESTADK